MDIVTLLKSDGKAAVEVLFREEYEGLCRTAYRYLSDKVIAEDIVQEVFFELWKRRDSLEINISLPAYLRRSVVNKSLNYIRDNRRTVAVAEPGQYLSQSSAAPAVSAAELQAVLRKGIDELPDKCREAFLLSRHEELSYKEIAEKLDISVKTVEKHIAKGLAHLRVVLRAHGWKAGVMMILWLIDY